mgnify:CR=1 FL=1
MTVLDDAPEIISDDELEDVKEVICKSCGDTFFVPVKQRGRPPAKCANCRSIKQDSAPVSEPAKAKASTTGRPSNLSKLEKSLTTQLAGVGSLVAVFQPFDGMVIVHNSADTSSALCKIAERNPTVRKALEQFVASSAYGELGFVLFATIGPILANHEVLPAQVATLGKVPEEAIPYFIPMQKMQAAEQARKNNEEHIHL